jgi:hypothetical protein
MFGWCFWIYSTYRAEVSKGVKANLNMYKKNKSK